MKKLLKILIPVIVIIFIFFALGPFYTIYEGEQAVITQFGEIIKIQTDAGLKIKTPVFHKVTKYSKRILSWDGAPQRIQTAENQFIWVDTTARWRISDPKRFYESVINMEGAYLKLDDVIDSAVRTIIAQNYLKESVRNSNIIIELQKKKKDEAAELIKEGEVSEKTEESKDNEDSLSQSDLLSDDTVFQEITKGRRKLSDLMLSNATKDTSNLGIELIDVVIRQIRYSDDMTQSVFDRMIKQRAEIAQYYRSEGDGRKLDIAGQKDKMKEEILSGAYKTSEKIKGEADAAAAAIYNKAYGKDVEFYEFWKAIESYKKPLPEMNKTLSTDMQYFNNFYNSDTN